ncbi:MAG: hypothetical protein JXA25_17060 [Anaerolineales bacterium]|nr:hypothetical protein [Anaerolineales bacterium]
MKSPSKKRRQWLPGLVAAITLVILLFFGLFRVYGQSDGAVIRVAGGYPTQLPADRESQTMLEVDISGCTFGGAAAADAQYAIVATASKGRLSPTFASTLDGGDFPPLLLLESTGTPGESLIQVTISYCPADAVFVLGVCSAPGSVNNECKGSMTFTFVEEEAEATSTGGSYWESDAHATEEAHHHTTEEVDARATEEARHHATETADAWGTVEAHHNNEEGSQTVSANELYQELTDYLAGEGITAPTPGQIGASGIALATLLAGWLVLNQLSGVSTQTSLEVIENWSHGQTPPDAQLSPESTPSPPSQETPPEDPSESQQERQDQPPEQENEPPDSTSLQPPGTVPEADLLQDSEQDAETDQEPPAPPSRPTPAQESTEDQILHNIQDVQDFDDAVKQTRKDFETFEGNIPESIRNSDIWKNNVENKIEKIKNLLAQGELDKTRTWLDRAEQLLQLRNEVEQDLNYLPSDSQEAILWTERTLRTLGHFASDTYQTLVIDPAKNAGNAVLPSELAQRWNGAMDELNQELSNVAQQVSELPRDGAQLLTHRNLQEQAQQMLQSGEQGTQEMGHEIQELYGPREVPVEYPDFMGRGTRKVQELWDHTMRCLFHD